ncbi:hypothetical protein GE09DRAFT_1293002 [Coniochaeta sp. 2T2.1]|nr:hypothetical protein GE09DRAFT_1293002 [Coniochaeta sp. 2T2.1]
MPETDFDTSSNSRTVPDTNEGSHFKIGPDMSMDPLSSTNPEPSTGSDSSTSSDSSMSSYSSIVREMDADWAAVERKIKFVREEQQRAYESYEYTTTTLRDLKESIVQRKQLPIKFPPRGLAIQKVEDEARRLLLRKLILFRDDGYEVAQFLADVEIDDGRQHDEAFDRQLVDEYLREASESTVLDTAEGLDDGEWQEAVFKLYNYQPDRLPRRPNQMWCPITGDFVSDNKVQRLIAPRIGNWVVDCVLDTDHPPDDNESAICSARNGIPMAPEFKRLWDIAAIVVVPSTDGRNLVVKVLDKNIWSPSIATLDGRVLKIPNGTGPDMRYLYFGFIINVLRRQRYEAPGWWRDHIAVTNVPLFKREHRCLKKTVVRTLAIRMGLMREREADEFVACTYANGRDDDEWAGAVVDAAASLIELAYRPAVILFLYWMFGVQQPQANGVGMYFEKHGSGPELENPNSAPKP